MTKLFLSVFCSTFVLTGSLSASAQSDILKGEVRLHDPAGLVEVDGYLMTFATGRTIRSAYLPPGSDEWVRGEPVFPRGQRPAWMGELLPNNKGFWAPHAAFPRVMYYSVADDSDSKDIAAIGRATAVGDPPNLTWIDDGKPVLFCDRSEVAEPFAIDPAVFEGANDTLWMVYGSHWSGIWIVELDPETGHIKDGHARENGWTPGNPAFTHVASELPRGATDLPEPGFTAGAIEAPYVYWSGKYYYLFVNWGKCCSGIDSTYEIRVGRSTSPQGPYLDKDGRDLADAGGTLFVETDGRFIGPGHANIYTYQDSKEKTRRVFTYHYYDGEAEGRPKMHARELVFDRNDWPVLTDTVFFKKE